MLSHNLKKWKIFNILESEFIQKISVAVVYGDSGDNAVIATYDNMVYALGPNIIKYPTHTGNDSIFKPIQINELCGKDIKTFACSEDHILALTNNGLVYSWKCSQHTNVSRTYTVTGYPKEVKQPPPPLRNHLHTHFILDIACGRDHFLALTTRGKVLVWDNKSSSNFELLKDSLTKEIITHISCGKNFSIVVTDKGQVYSWGENTVGQLGTPSYDDVNRPFKITALDSIVIEKVVCGYAHTLALSTMGCLYVWGGNSCGQLGLNTTKNTFIPVELKIKEMEKVQNVAACSASHISVAILENKQVFIWGYCMGENILAPICTKLKCFHDAFAYYGWPRVTYRPLTFYDESNSNLITSLEEAFNDPDTSDLVYLVEGKAIYVHKAVLEIRCQHFRTMFQDTWAESRQNVIENNQFSYKVYKSFLYYLYTDKIDLFSYEEIVELLSLADMYVISQLKNRCSKLLVKEVAIKNVVYLYSISINYDIKELQKYCLIFALNNTTEVVRTTDFKTLDKNIIIDFFTEVAEAGAFQT